MWHVPEKFGVKLGGNTYVNTPNMIVYKGTPIFKIRRSDHGMLGIDFDVYDARGKKAATFAMGIVVQGDKDNYVITTGHDEYTVTEKTTGRVIASVKRRGVEGAELEVSAKLYMPDGFLLDATPTHTNIGGSMKMAGCTFTNCQAGIAIN